MIYLMKLKRNVVKSKYEVEAMNILLLKNIELRHATVKV